MKKRTEEHTAKIALAHMESHDREGIYARVKKCAFAVPCKNDAIKSCLFREFCQVHCGCQKRVSMRARKREIYMQISRRKQPIPQLLTEPQE